MQVWCCNVHKISPFGSAVLQRVSAHCLHVQEAASASELKRIIEGLPLETSAVAGVEWRLGRLDPGQFAALLTELARDNHAFRSSFLRIAVHGSSTHWS